MAAAYSTGISSSPQNLLQTLVSWLTVQGWTVDSSVSDGTGWRAHLHKNSLYVNLRAAMNEKIWPHPTGHHDYGDGGYGIGIYLGDGYSGSETWDEQSGRPVRPGDGSTLGAGANLPSGSVSAYHLFDDGSDNIIVVVERSPGIFCHFGWGPDMAEAGQPEVFPYLFGSSSQYMNTHDGVLLKESFGIDLSALPPISHGNKERNSYSGTTTYVHTNALVRVDAATFSDRWISNGNQGITAGYGYSGRFMRCALNRNPDTYQQVDEKEFPGYVYILERTHQTAFVGSILLPLHCYVLTDPGARWAPIGYPLSIFWTEAVGQGYAPGDIYQVGGVNYMLFPHFAVAKGA